MPTFENPLTPDQRQAFPACSAGQSLRQLFSSSCACGSDEDNENSEDDDLTLNAQCQSPAATLALEPRM